MCILVAEKIDSSVVAAGTLLDLFVDTATENKNEKTQSNSISVANRSLTLTSKM